MTKWNGTNLSQDELMLKDECIVVSPDDVIIGHASKKETHVFSTKQPRGVLHRAFSVFLFNSEGKLLLQQRAADKITFPSVWTNTCCSHPLYGYTPSEADDAAAVANGTVPGVKAAAVRKLLHELGIKAKDVPISKFKFLTRLHYWAADVVTHGPKSPWGEHEIDYILFIQADVKLKPNPEEVSDVKYVTLPELQSMMKSNSGLLWSPWFRIIVEKFLVHWWDDLDRTMNTNDFVDCQRIYRFDPSTEHMGGAGKAGKYLGATDYAPPAASARKGDLYLKQGAYGKVQIHKHSKLDQILRVRPIITSIPCQAMHFLSIALHLTLIIFSNLSFSWMKYLLDCGWYSVPKCPTKWISKMKMTGSVMKCW